MAEYKDMSREELGSSNTFAAQLEEFASFCMERADEVFYEIVLSLTSKIIEKSPVDTGRFKANWQYSKNGYTTGSLNQYDIAGAGPYGKDQGVPHKTVDAHAEARKEISANKPKMGDTVYIYNNLIYSVPLEYGWSNQAPSGVVRINLALVGAEFTKTVGKLSI